MTGQLITQQTNQPTSALTGQLATALPTDPRYRQMVAAFEHIDEGYASLLAPSCTFDSADNVLKCWWSKSQCRFALKQLGLIIQLKAYYYGQLIIPPEFATAVEHLQNNIIKGFQTSGCFKKKIDSTEHPLRALHKIGLEVVKRAPTTPYTPNNNLINNNPRILEPGICQPKPIYTPTPILTEPWFDLNDPYHDIYIILTLIGVQVTVIAGGALLIATRALSCIGLGGGAAGVGTGGGTTLAIVSKSAASVLASKTTQLAASGLLSIAIVGELQAKSKEINQGNTGPLIPLEGDDVNDVFNTLISDPQGKNKEWETYFKNQCTGKEKLDVCPNPTTPDGSGASLTPSPVYTPTETPNACDPAYLNNLQEPKTHARTTQGFNFVDVFFEPPPDLQYNFYPLDAEGNIMTATNVAIQYAFVGSVTGKAEVVQYEPPADHAPARHAFSVGQACANNPGGILFFAVVMQYYSKSQCKYVTLTYFDQYSCGSKTTGGSSTETVWTPAGGTPPNIYNHLMEMLTKERKYGPLTGTAQSCKANKPLIPPNTCDDNCKSNELCAPGCKGCVPKTIPCGSGWGTGGKLQGQTCSSPGKCTAPEKTCDVNSCLCVEEKQPKTPSGGGRASPATSPDFMTGQAIIGSPAQIALQQPIEESWTIVTDAPGQPVTIDYINSNNEQGHIIADDDLLFTRIDHVDGTTTTFNRDTQNNNRIQSIINTGGITHQYTYDVQGELRSILSQYPGGEEITTEYVTTATGSTRNYDKIDQYLVVPVSNPALVAGAQTPVSSVYREITPHTVKQTQPYTTTVITKKTDYLTFEDYEIALEPQISGGYVTGHYIKYNGAGDILQRTKTVTFHGVKIWQRTYDYAYHIDLTHPIAGIKRLDTITCRETGRTYTYRYTGDPLNPSPYDAFIGVFDDEGDRISKEGTTRLEVV